MAQIELRSNLPEEEMFEQAGPLLDEIEYLIQKAVFTAKKNIFRDGTLSEKYYNHFQQCCYTFSVAQAELEAARALLAHAKSSEDSLMLSPCALFFCAEVINSILSSFLKEGDRSGVSRMEISKLLNREDVVTWLSNAAINSNLAGYSVETGDMRLPTGLSEEKELVRSTFQRFADEIVAPRAEEIHRQDLDIPEEIIQQAAELGCFGTCIPERFGGLQPDESPDSLGMIIVTEELSRGSLGAAGSLITRPEIAARALLAGGTESQQQTWLPKLATGETLCAISITEPNTGSDVASVNLRATPTDGGWLLNGGKTWCTFAGRSELVVVLARTNPDTTLGHKGLSLFLIEKPKFAGHEFSHQQEGGGSFSGKAIATLGYRGMHSYELFFDDYFVPESNLVGEKAGEGKGFYYTMAGFAGGRIQTAARAIGVMQAAYEAAVNYARERHVFAKPLSDYQVNQLKLSRMLAIITASRQFSYAVAAKMDQGEGQMEASLVKLFTCRAAEWVTREAMQIHGGMGYAEESAVSRYFVDARVLSIFEGAEEVLAIRVVARELMEQHDHESFEKAMLERYQQRQQQQ